MHVGSTRQKAASRHEKKTGARNPSMLVIKCCKKVEIVLAISVVVVWRGTSGEKDQFAPHFLQPLSH
jgi:hypothetical protein